jgi:isoleucyl-tRNA synthetase
MNMSLEKYKVYQQLNLPGLSDEIQKFWDDHHIFEESLSQKKNHPPYIFYEGPPSANGMPGIHHVMARAIKDIFCRYKSMKGYYVARKAGWDTHGLPVEIGVEKKLGITKEDIGTKITIEEYNAECRKEVMKYKDLWDDLTIKMGYWVDLDDPYITFENKYIETIWYLLSKLYERGLLYKGYTIQPFSPAAGTGLSTHELNQPGCYRMVKDNTLVAQFKVVKNEQSDFLFKDVTNELFFLAWTTTPWTLPSNTGLAVGKNIVYALVQTYNPYTYQPITVILAKETLSKFFDPANAGMDLAEFEPGNKKIPYRILSEYTGSQLIEINFEQLLPYSQPTEGNPFRVVTGDFVTTEEGTGIVHIAPSFGADDFRVGKQYDLGALTLVDRQGRFTSEMGEFAGRFVKPEYDPEYDAKNPKNVDIDIIVKLKKENRAFRSEKYEHSYPHCWRTDKPILYYPLDSWFIKTTAFKDQLIELNKTIQWKPESTGTGRFGNWLENLVDWNLSRSRFWGTPLPIWRTDDGSEEICIGSVEQLQNEINKSVSAGFMMNNPLEGFNPGDFSAFNYNKFDLHRPIVDEIILQSASGKKMFREPDLIDVWFDSGAMPYAQFHYPFEKSDELQDFFPADFIAEGVDQTRGWFYTLHAIATLVFGSVAFKTVVANGLVLDKEGNKMSKRLGNAVDPFETISKYGPDATRWYMITNSQPWDNLKFDINGIAEVQRKFFGTLYNTYSFFALYANIDGFSYSEPDVPIEKRPEIDRWILSELNTLIKQVDESYSEYEPTRAGRLISWFVDEYLSNWYVRLCRRRFWKGEYTDDKISAYQTLYRCLEVLAQLASPIAPFFTERLFADLNSVTGRFAVKSVHMTDFPETCEAHIDLALEKRMELAQKITSMVLALRKKMNIRVRQPLNKIIIPAASQLLIDQITQVSSLIVSELNLKTLEFVSEDNSLLVKKIKPDFKKLGPKYGKLMKSIAASIVQLSQNEIRELEVTNNLMIVVEGTEINVSADDCEISTEDIPGWVVSTQGQLTVALDVTLTPELLEEGYTRDLVNRIQNLRKDSNFDVTDRIQVSIFSHPVLDSCIKNNYSYICSETLANSIQILNSAEIADGYEETEISDDIITRIRIVKD